MKKEQKISLLAVNYAFQKTFNWGNSIWRINEKQLQEIRMLIDNDNPEITGKNIWSYFHSNINRAFYTTYTMCDLGNRFINYLKQF